jgi:hypothetical protein
MSSYGYTDYVQKARRENELGAWNWHSMLITHGLLSGLTSVRFNLTNDSYVYTRRGSGSRSLLRLLSGSVGKRVREGICGAADAWLKQWH